MSNSASVGVEIVPKLLLTKDFELSTLAATCDMGEKASTSDLKRMLLSPTIPEAVCDRPGTEEYDNLVLESFVE